VEHRPPLRSALVGFAVLAGLASTASCLLTSNFDGLTGNETTSSGASTGSHASSTGAASAGGGGSGGASASSTGTGGTGGTGGGTGGSGGAGCMQKNIGGSFPATCVLDDFDRANGDPGLNWLMQGPNDYSILNHQLVTPTPAMPGDVVRPGTTLWSPALGPTQEMFITLSTFTADDYELELILKAQSSPMECGAIQVSYHQGTLDVSYCEINGTFIGMPPGPASVTLHPGDQFGARATVDGKLLAYQNGHLLGTWDSTGFSGYASGGRVGIEMDGLVDKLAFDDFGGGGQ
jgi:hypothetical protein